MNLPSKKGHTGKRRRSLLSCTECHRRKQKCDRLLPCNDCTLRGVPYKCEYEAPKKTDSTFPIQGKDSVGQFTWHSPQRRIINGPQLVFVLETNEDIAGTQMPIDVAAPARSALHDINAVPTGFYQPPRKIQLSSPAEQGTSDLNCKDHFLGGCDPFHVFPEAPSHRSPVKQFLIPHFISQLTPWLSAYEDTKSPRLSWLPEALHHSALFHATLLAAAVHLHRMQPSTDPQIALWYKGETIRLINEDMTRPAEGASDHMILVVLILLYFTVPGVNREEYYAHVTGIDQMLKMRGGMENLGLRGMVKNWLLICHGPWSPGVYHLNSEHFGI